MAGSRFVAALAALAVLAFPAPGAFAEETVKVSGTGGAIGGMKQLGEAFGRKHHGMTVNVFPSTGSTGGIKAVVAGKLDLAVSSRRIRTEEMVPGLVEKPYLKTPFLFATSTSNPVDGLRLSEIQDIYAGRKTTWPGGKTIFLVIRPATDAFTNFLEDISPGMKDAVATSKKRRGMFTGITDQDAADEIERASGSFGVTSYTLVAFEKRRIKALAVDGIPPVTRNGINGRYPYFITFYLVYKNDRNAGAVGKFIDYIGSRDGDNILKKGGAIPIGKAQGKP